MILECICIWMTILLVSYYWINRHILIVGGRLPCLKRFPIIGNAYQFWGSGQHNQDLVHSLSTIYKRLLAIWMGPLLYVTIFTAKDTETILKSRSIIKAAGYKFLKPWLGNSILISEGEKFKHNRKLVSSAFHIPNLKQYIGVFSNYGEDLVKNLESLADGDEFDVHPYLSLSTMFVLLETSMGVKKETLGTRALEYSKAASRLGNCVHARAYKFWLQPEFLFKYSNVKKVQDESLKVVHPLTDNVVRERKNFLETSRKNQDSVGEDQKWPIFIDKFLQVKDDNGIGLTDQDVKDEVMTMMFAGQDTTTVSIGFALCLLGLHQNVQDILLREIDDVFGDSDRPVTYEDCKKLSYMEQVIQETWRLYSPVPMIARKPLEDIDIGEYVLPRLCTVAIMIAMVHRDPAVYPNPKEFNPDNFTPEKVKQRSPYSFIPFSAGQRTCVGQKYAMLLIKVTLSHLLRNYRVYSTISRNKYKVIAQTTLKRKDGFMISIKNRK